MIIKVQVTLIVPVEIPDDPDYDMHFDIEENHCPGTGRVGAAIEKTIEECSENFVCWGHRLQGENKILLDEPGEKT